MHTPHLPGKQLGQPRRELPDLRVGVTASDSDTTPATVQQGGLRIRQTSPLVWPWQRSRSSEVMTRSTSPGGLSTITLGVLEL